MEENTSTEAPTVDTTNEVSNEQDTIVEPDTLYAGKFKSVDELTKSYEHLQSKLGSFQGAPEEYAVNEGVEISEDNALFGKLQEVGRDLGLNNDGYNTLINMYNEVMADEEANYEAQVQEEMGKLGDNSQERIQNINDWTKANLSEAEQNVINSMSTSAEAVQLVEKFIAMSKPQGVAQDHQVQTRPNYDADKIHEMRYAKDANGNRKMSTDSEYRAKVLALEAQYA